MNNKKCPFCGGKLINRKNVTFRVGTMILGSVTFKGRLVCSECKSVCLRR